MSKYAKWIGGGLGWTFGGPIGGLIGFALGSLFDNVKFEVGSLESGGARTTTPNDFNMSLLVLSAAIMKADGKVVKAELDYVKAFFKQQFGVEQTKRDMLILRDLLQKPIPLAEVCQQIRRHMPAGNRLQLMHYVFGIGLADGHLDTAEKNVLQQIAQWLGISATEFQSLLGTYNLKDANRAYDVLEISSDATDEEVRKAYRKMARKYHPDRSSNLGPEHVKHAEENFKKIQEAYSVIKKERNLR